MRKIDLNAYVFKAVYADFPSKCFISFQHALKFENVRKYKNGFAGIQLPDKD